MPYRDEVAHLVDDLWLSSKVSDGDAGDGIRLQNR